MKFYEVQPAFNNGKKIKSKKFGTFFFKDAHLYYEHRELIEPIRGFAISVILADDWEIVEDVPEVKLEGNFTFFCPNCQTHRVLQQLKIPGFEKEAVTCGNCGTKVKLTNSYYEVLNSEFNKNASQDLISKYKAWLQHMIEISDQDLLTYSGEMNFVKAGEYEIRRGVFEECLCALNEMEGDSK